MLERPLAGTGKRVREIRKLHGFNQNNFGARIGASYDQISSWERGLYKVPRWAIINISREFQVAEHCIAGQKRVTEPPSAGDRVPIVGKISGGGQAEIKFTKEGLPVARGFQKIDRPPWLKDPTGFALVVRKGFMYPPFMEGTIVLVDTKSPVSQGDMALVHLNNGLCYWRIYRKQRGIVSLDPISPGGHQTIVAKSHEVVAKFSVAGIIPPHHH